MYSFAGSFNVSMIAEPLWQQAMEKAALCNIEISTSRRPEDELAQKVAADVLRLQKSGAVRAASLHLPFGPEINFSSDNEEMRRKAEHRVKRRSCKQFQARRGRVPSSTQPNRNEDMRGVSLRPIQER